MNKEQSSGAATPEKGSSVAEVALDRLMKGHVCAQSTFTAFAEQMGMDYDIALKVSSGFGGGMWKGSICGGVAGCIMAIGLKYGGPTEENRIRTTLQVRKLTERLEVKHGSINCAHIIGLDVGKHDLNTREDYAELYWIARANNSFANCPKVVLDAVAITSEILNEGD